MIAREGHSLSTRAGVDVYVCVAARNVDRVLERHLLRQTRRLILYPSPIDVRWGPDRLRLICDRDLGLTLDGTTAVVFYNARGAILTSP